MATHIALEILYAALFYCWKIKMFDITAHETGTYKGVLALTQA